MERFIQAVIDMWNGINWSYLPLFLFLAVVYFYTFKVLKRNKCSGFIAVIYICVIILGVCFGMSQNLPSWLLLIVVCLLPVGVFSLFNVEIKRSITNYNSKKKTQDVVLPETGAEKTIDEIVRAIQHMSKNDIGALIVLANENLPEGIVSSGTIINADINSQMIEAVFYPKAPLHDGAMIIEGNKIHAAGCFLPLVQNDTLPQEIGSRHRAALGVSVVAAVTVIVVSEETGIVSIVKNGTIQKRYANDYDLKKVLKDYYWTDFSVEG